MEAEPAGNATCLCEVMAQVASLLSKLPNEHGFWVMLGAALVSALLRADAASASVVAAGSVLVSAALLGGLVHRRIRRSSTAQLASAAMLALSAIPVLAAGKVPLPDIVTHTVALGVLFLASTLVVRAAFARSARNGQSRAVALHTGSVLLGLLGAACFAAFERTNAVVSCTLVAGSCAALFWRRPTAKQLKPVGLALSGLALASALALGF